MTTRPVLPTATELLDAEAQRIGFLLKTCPNGHRCFQAYGQPWACQTCGWIDPEVCFCGHGKGWHWRSCQHQECDCPDYEDPTSYYRTWTPNPPPTA